MPSPTPARHPSVVALMKAHPRQTDPKQVIRELARSRVAHAKALRWSGPPFCPKEFASVFDIRCREVTHEIGGDGRILVQRDGKFRIEYRKQNMPERQRFTIFHEFAHTLFPDFGTLLPRHHAPGAALTREEKEFENLCDVAAAEMLMPLEEFTRDLRSQPAGDLASVHVLRRIYQASIDATVHRVIDLEQRCGCMAVFLTDQKGKFEGNGPLWVKYSTLGKRFASFIWPGSTPPVKSVVLDCFQQSQDILQPAKESWLTKGREIPCIVQAIRLPELPEFPDYAKVVALLKTAD